MKRLTAEQLEGLRRYDTCRVANAIETFGLRIRTEGFVYPSLKCFCGPVLGYAVTARIVGSHPPPTPRPYLDRTDWWNILFELEGPLVAVIQDVDERPGMGAAAGEIHANILKRLNCTGLITNGSIRDVPALKTLEFAAFAAGVTPSHAYVHTVDHGEPVEINGLAIVPGDLLYGDEHGIVSIPLEIASDLPRVIAEQRKTECEIVALCGSPEFSLERLRAAVK